VIPLTSAGGGDDMTAFYNEISSIQDSISQFNSNVQKISDLHSRSLNTIDEQATAENTQQLDSLIGETSSLSNEIKHQIKDLERRSGGRDANAKRQQINSIKQRFLEAIQNYQNVEHQYRFKYEQRIAMQYKIGALGLLSSTLDYMIRLIL
jgi:syntaxin 1B/2/3